MSLLQAEPFSAHSFDTIASLDTCKNKTKEILKSFNVPNNEIHDWGNEISGKSNTHTYLVICRTDKNVIFAVEKGPINPEQESFINRLQKSLK